MVEPSGSVALGPQYGRVKIGGLSLEDAEKAVAAHLKKTLRGTPRFKSRSVAGETT